MSQTLWGKVMRRPADEGGVKGIRGAAGKRGKMFEKRKRCCRFRCFSAKKTAEFFSIKRAAFSFLSEKIHNRNKENPCRDNSPIPPPQKIFIRAATKEMHHSPLLLPQKNPRFVKPQFLRRKKIAFRFSPEETSFCKLCHNKEGGSLIFPRTLPQKEGDSVFLRKLCRRRGEASSPCKRCRKKGDTAFPRKPCHNKEGEASSSRKLCHKKERHSASPCKLCHKKRRKRQTFPPDFFHRSI